MGRHLFYCSEFSSKNLIGCKWPWHSCERRRDQREGEVAVGNMGRLKVAKVKERSQWGTWED
ncbi:hypothetical protein AXX17_AT5G37250 [Arabidopsis thaliana]|uniref:Uncharacterized protein n=1 Tax=Arabidopsis thaliana TaxID=3702 RepID=A0A178UEZ6_ARATH|nr:hypothetical protein AXX17_AT5G37250 [Arabidopsis thaliana]